MKDEDDGPPNRELYALLHISPDASDDDIRKSYRQWAQIYHPDKIQAPHMKEAATENFQRICEAYEILTDENKRKIYDIYGMEVLTSGLELGTKLNKAEELKEELEGLRKLKELEKVAAHFQSSGAIVAKMSFPRFLSGDGFMRGMAMTSSVQSQISKRNTVTFGGYVAINGNSGGGGATLVFDHQLSPVSSMEIVVSTGLRSLLAVQTSRHLSQHLSATMGLAMSLKDGSLNLSNMWTRELSETTSGNIELNLGSDSSIAIGWQKKEEKASASGQLKILLCCFSRKKKRLGLGSFEASANYTHRLSTKSHAHLEGKFGSHALVIEVAGGRKISKFSSVRMLYSIGIQGIFWKFELHRGGQKLVIPKLIVKPYYLMREKQKALENMKRTSAKVQEARAAADKAQQLLQNIANRKQKKQQEIGGLVITKAMYGSVKALKKRDEPSEPNDELVLQFVDVTLPLNFLVSDDGQLKLHEGVMKSGIMGFCDPCPGEPKQLHVEYTYGGNAYEAVVDDYAELLIPQEKHRI